MANIETLLKKNKEIWMNKYENVIDITTKNNKILFYVTKFNPYVPIVIENFQTLQEWKKIR